MATFWATFGKIKDIFYSNIWSHGFPDIQGLHEEAVGQVSLRDRRRRARQIAVQA